MDPNGLDLVSNSCKALRSFEFISSEDLGAGSKPSEVLGARMLPVEALESLHLNFDDQQNRIDNSRVEALLSRDLPNLMRLKTLETCMQALAGFTTCLVPLKVHLPILVACLPENLESLTDHCCTGRIAQQAQELLDMVGKGDRFRNLKSIPFLFKKDGNVESLYSISYPSSELRCQSSGTKLPILFQPVHERDYSFMQIVRWKGAGKR